MKKTLVAVAAAAIVMAPMAGPVSGQYGGPVADITLSDASISCATGETLTITGEGFLPNEPFVRIFFDGDQIAQVFPDDQGNISVTVDPPGAAAGQHTISAEQFVAPEEDDLITASATVTCVGAAVAVTGANISVGLILLITLLIVGAGAIFVGRRRARSAA